MNMAMLWRELGTDVEKWPQVLTFGVIDIESKSATEENRKRLKFCRHLPVNAPFDLVEVNLDEFGISPEIKADFASQIHQRQQRRRNRVKEEKILERKQRELELQEFNKLRHMPQVKQYIICDIESMKTCCANGYATRVYSFVHLWSFSYHPLKSFRHLVRQLRSKNLH